MAAGRACGLGCAGLPGKVQVARGGGMSQKFYKLPVEIVARKDLTPAGKILWAVLADRIGNNGFCWPGVRSIARDARLDVSTVLESVRKLEVKGLLQVERRGNGRANHYRLATSESAGEIQALGKSKRSENPNSGAGKIRAQALGKSKHNQTDQLNQTKDIRPNSETLRLAELLLNLILASKPDFKKPNLKVWSGHIERMIRLDKRKPERIEAVIRWSQQDPFWQSNILSTAKLREQFDRLELNMGKRKNGTTYRRDFDEQDSHIGTVVKV